MPLESVPASPDPLADPTMSNFFKFLQANITELTANNKKLNEVAQRQHDIIQSLDKEVKSCKRHISALESRVTSLEDEVDAMQQEKLENKLLISGPAMKRFLSCSSEGRAGGGNLGMHSLRSLRILVGSLTIDRSQLSEPENLEDTTTVFNNDLPSGEQMSNTEGEPAVIQPGSEQLTPSARPQVSEIKNPEATANAIINNLTRGVQVADAEINPAINELVKEQGITSAFILSDRDGNPERVAITVESRESALAILTRGKLTKKSLYFSEQLTKRRGHLMYRLRGLCSKFSFIRMTVFSRNGCPAVRVGDGRFNFIKSEEDLQNLNSLLERSATFMSNDDSVRRQQMGSDETRRVNGLVESARQRTTNGVVSDDVRLNAEGVQNARAL